MSDPDIILATKAFSENIKDLVTTSVAWNAGLPGAGGGNLEVAQTLTEAKLLTEYRGTPISMVSYKGEGAYRNLKMSDKAAADIYITDKKLISENPTPQEVNAARDKVAGDKAVQLKSHFYSSDKATDEIGKQLAVVIEHNIKDNEKRDGSIAPLHPKNVPMQKAQPAQKEPPKTREDKPHTSHEPLVVKAATDKSLNLTYVKGPQPFLGQ